MSNINDFFTTTVKPQILCFSGESKMVGYYIRGDTVFGWPVFRGFTVHAYLFLYCIAVELQYFYLISTVEQNIGIKNKRIIICPKMLRHKIGHRRYFYDISAAAAVIS